MLIKNNIFIETYNLNMYIKHLVMYRTCVVCMIISPVSEGSGDVMVLRRSRPPPAARRPPPAMVLTR